MKKPTFEIELKKHEFHGEIQWSGSIRKIIDSESLYIQEPFQGITSDGVIDSLIQKAASIDFENNTINLLGVGKIDSLNVLEAELIKLAQKDQEK